MFIIKERERKIKIAIVEDTFQWMDKIQDSVNNFFQDKAIEVEIDKYYDAESFLDAKKEYEIVYLDIELSSTRGSMNGIEALWRYKQVFPNIIAALVTVHEKEVRKGYFVGAYRYIYKRNLEEEIQEMLEGEATEEKREYLQKENQLWQKRY